MRKTRSLKLAEKAARMAGDILIERFQKDAGIIKDQGRDIKTLADQDAEAKILKTLRPTGTPILTEEAGADADPGTDEDYDLDCYNEKVYWHDPMEKSTKWPFKRTPGY